MPIDDMMLNPMLDPFRNMLKEVEEKNLSGENYDKMKDALNRMEALGQEHSDIMTFNGALMQENLFGKFSDYYGKLLAESAKKEGEAKGYDDSTLLKQSIDALKSAVDEIKRNYQLMIDESKKHQQDNPKGKQIDPSIEASILNDPTIVIKGIEDVIALGEQEGMTLPKFLKLQIETGLDKAMEGSTALRRGLEFTLDATKATARSPFLIQVDDEKLNAFDELANKSEFNVPNTKELSYLHKQIDYRFRHSIAEWDEITNRWENLLYSLSFWSLSYTKVAPYILPWSTAADPKAATIETQKTVPGIFQEELKLLKKYFGMDFMDIFKHITFIWGVEHFNIGDSQEYVNFLIEKVYPECQPFNDLPQNIIDERLSFHEENRTDNPEAYKSIERYKYFYDGYFGEGRFEEKFGVIEESSSQAQPWDLSTFKHSS